MATNFGPVTSADTSATLRAAPVLSVSIGPVTAVEASQVGAANPFVTTVVSLGPITAVEQSAVSSAVPPVILPLTIYASGNFLGSADLWPSNRPAIYSLANPDTPCDQRVLTNAVVSGPVTGISTRFKWRTLQPTAPTIVTNDPNDPSWNWSFIDSEISRAAAAGKKILLRAEVQGTNTPHWIMNNPSVQVFTPDVADSDPPIWVYWDPIAQPAMWAMYQAVAARYANPSSPHYAPNFTIFAIAGGTDSSGDWAMPIDGNDITNWLDNYGYTTQRALNAFQATIDVAMAAFPSPIIITLAVGRNGNLDPTSGGFPAENNIPYYLANQLTNYGYETYGNRFASQKNSVNNYDPVPALSWGSNFQLLYQNLGLGLIGGQATWWCYEDTTYRNNHGVAPPDAPVNASVLAGMLEIVNAYRMRWFECYETDVLNLSNILIPFTQITSVTGGPVSSITPIVPVFTTRLAPDITIYVNGVPYTFNSPGVTLLNPTPGSLEEALQRVFNVLLVPLHSQILGWTYGVDTSWLDAPFNRRVQQGIAATVKAIGAWVPNVTVKDCKIIPLNNGVFNAYTLAITLDFNPPNKANQAVFAPPGGTAVTTVDLDANGNPAVLIETLTV